MQQILKTANLPEVRDGLVATLLDEQLLAVFRDCVDRPGLKKAREVTLKVKVTPNGDDVLELANVEFEVPQAKLPAQSLARPMQANRKRNGFGFESDTDATAYDESQQSFE